MTPLQDDTPPPETPEPEQFTLEEWIAATQSCCGIHHDEDSPPPSE